jgi:signal transduction histidine kinase
MDNKIEFGEVAFNPRARLLKLLGGELIRDDVMALVEIIKNSYDADASRVHLSFEDVAEPGGTIIVSDDGTGMTVEALLNHWMQPAGSSKKLNGRRSPGGRRYLGEKGVGRFAVDRLGQYCEVISRAKGSKTEIAADFDWDAFDTDDAFLSDIKMNWMTRKPEVLDKHGTILRIGGLRQIWNARSFRRLSNRLSRLLSPFGAAAEEFAIELSSDEFPDYAGELGNPYFKSAPYRLIAKYDGGEFIDIEFNGEREQFIWPGPGGLQCGPVNISVHSFDLETDAVRRVGPVQDVRAWLREWSGFSVYRDGFRVLPYGEPDDDWLRLDQRRVNNPVVRLSNNQIIGVAEITAEKNPALTDQTNRLGLDHNREYDDFRKLTLWVMEILEERRQQLRNPPTVQLGEAPPDISITSVDSVVEALRKRAPDVSKKAGFALGGSLDELLKAYNREKSSMLEFQERHSELAAFGHNIGFLASSLRPILGEIEREISILVDRSDDASIYPLNGLVSRAIRQLELLDTARSVVRESSREIDLIKVTRLFSEAAEDIASTSSDQPTSVIISLPKEELVLVDGRRDLYWQILSTLLQNSLQAMARSKKREIRIRVKLTKSGNKAVVSFKDTGSGIPEKFVDRIFEAGYTTRTNFRGMGLPIARNLAEGMKASLEFRPMPRDRRQGYTTFELTFPLASIMNRNGGGS